MSRTGLDIMTQTRRTVKYTVIGYWFDKHGLTMQTRPHKHNEQRHSVRNNTQDARTTRAGLKYAGV